jgi:hypothetical protein
MGGNWQNSPNDRNISTTIPDHWFSQLECWMVSNLSSTASNSDAVRAILAKELGIPFPGETIKRNHQAEREERAEAYLEAHHELGSWKMVARKFEKSTTTVASTIRRYQSEQRRAALKHQNTLIGGTRPAPMSDD